MSTVAFGPQGFDLRPVDAAHVSVVTWTGAAVSLTVPIAVDSNGLVTFTVPTPGRYRVIIASPDRTYTKTYPTDLLVAGLDATSQAYATQAQVAAATGGPGGTVTSVNGQTGVVVLGAADVSAAASNDSRLTDARTPTAHASTHATGQTDPIAPSDIGAVPTSRQVIASTGLSGGGALSGNVTLSVAFGSTGSTVAVGNDARLADARTPTAHASTHGSGQSDPITIAESQVTNLTTDLSGKTATSRQVLSGAGISGGGDLSADRTFTLVNNNAASLWGFLAMNQNPGPGTAGNSTPVAGTQYAMRVVAEADAASGTRTMAVFQALAFSGITSAILCVYDSTGTKIGANSADQSASWNGGTGNRLITVGTFAVTKGSIYYLTFIQVTGITGTIGRSSNGGGQNINVANANIMWGTLGTGLSAPVASFTPSSGITANGFGFFGALA